MTQKEELLTAFDEAWSFKWESIESVLNDISDEEALYQHPSYSNLQQEESHPPPGTILTLLVHLADCYGYYRALIIHRPEMLNVPPPLEAGNMKVAMSNLMLRRLELREAIDSLAEAQFEEKIYNHKSVAQLIRMLIRHDAWHSGQIALIKRLYRNTIGA